MGPKIKEVKFEGFNCVEFTNGTIKLVIPRDIGPRVLYAGFNNEMNLFGCPDASLRTSLGLWKIHGGHRLWTSPESKPESYYPDNSPIGIHFDGKTLKLRQGILALGINKEITLQFVGKNKVKAGHIIKNTARKSQRYAAWCLSVMAKGGFAIIPQNTKKDKHGLLANKNLVLWRYAKFDDKRVKLAGDYCYVRQGGEKQFKIGQLIESGWAAYANKGYIFVKKFKHHPGKEYPDFYCNVEVYTNNKFLELETLSPLMNLKPGQTASHTEVWEFYKNQSLRFGDHTQDL